jgi:6-phosphofructokinase 1
MVKNIAVLTSGGDSPGMNACVRAVVKSALNKGIVPYGVIDGYQGMMEGRIRKLGFRDVDNIIYRGGTILGTARSEEFRKPAGREKAFGELRKHNIDGLIVIGGDGSFAGATALSSEFGLNVIGIPGTIDNDIAGTDHTIGYDTALNTVVEAVDKIRDTASSHHRIFFIEVMGRNAGFIALNAALASGAEGVLIPEEVTDIKVLVSQIREQNKGMRSSIIIVAEGDDGGGATDIMEKVKPFLKGYELRHSVLGHIQRGGGPSAFDRILATRMGAMAVDLLATGSRDLMIGASGDHLVTHALQFGINNKAIPDLTKLDLLQQLLTKG